MEKRLWKAARASRSRWWPATSWVCLADWLFYILMIAGSSQNRGEYNSKAAESLLSSHIIDGLKSIIWGTIQRVSWPRRNWKRPRKRHKIFFLPVSLLRKLLANHEAFGSHRRQPTLRSIECSWNLDNSPPLWSRNLYFGLQVFQSLRSHGVEGEAGQVYSGNKSNQYLGQQSSPRELLPGRQLWQAL